MSASSMELVSVLISLAAFAFAAWLFSWVKKQPLDNERIIQVGGLIQQGARTFLRREFMVLARFCVCAALLIFLFLPSPIWTGSFVPNLMMVIAYLAGTIFSGLAGKIGIEVATIANGKCAVAAKKGIVHPNKVARVKSKIAGKII